MKILPQVDFESPKDAYIPKPKLRSCRYPCKVMFMGLVCPPVTSKEGKILTNGKIMLKCVSEEMYQKRASYNQNFVSDYETNHALKNQKWKALYPKNGDIITKDFLALICETYNFDEDIASDVVLTYDSFSQLKDKKTIKKKLMKLTLEDEKSLLVRWKIQYKVSETELKERPLKLSDLWLKVNPKTGCLIEKDVTCDLHFMMDNIRDTGKNIRATYSFFHSDKPVFLFMDNTGGHGKTKVKREYEEILKNEYNMNVVRQESNSPETNMLDLGVWTALQSKVKTIHCGKVM